MDPDKNYDYELEMARLQSHERHMGHIYGIRRWGLGVSAFTILIGAVMIFMGLQGTISLDMNTTNALSAKLTNASPGIIFAVVGVVLAFIVIIQSPVNYSTGQAMTDPPRRRKGKSSPYRGGLTLGASIGRDSRDD